MLALSVLQSAAQLSIPVHFEPLTINDGLSQGFVSSIVQDKKDFMWFGTGDGLNKFDGYNFTIYHHSPADFQSLSSDDISYVYEDSKERLWICTNSTGLDLFDREHLIFYHITRASGLSSDNVLSISEDNSGNFWVRTSKGLDYMRIAPGKQNTGSKRNFLAGYYPIIRHLDTDKIYKLSATDHPPQIYESSLGKRYVYNGSMLFEMNFAPATFHYSFKKLLDYTCPYKYTEEVGNILEDRLSQNLYINTWKGIYRVSGNSPDSFKLFYIHPGYARFTWCMDKEGNLLLPEEGFIRKINAKNASLSKISSDVNDFRNALNYTTSLYVDRTGLLWIGSSGYGILKYNPSKEKFHHLLPGQSIYRMLKDTGNHIRYISVYNNYSINNLGTVVLKKIDSNNLPRDYPAMVPFGEYSCIDSNNYYWLGLSGHLNRYRGQNKSVKKFDFPFTGQPNGIRYPFIDRTNFLWFGTGDLLVRFNTTTFNYVTFRFPLQRIYVDFLQLIYQDIKGDLWLATRQGLFRFNPATQQWKHWSHNERDSTSLSNDFVLSFCDDPLNPSQYIWAGTKGGLNKINKRTGAIQHINTENGLPNNVIYGILPDDKSNLWLSTNRGLCKYNVATGAVYNFNVSDGLQSNEFNRYAFIKNNEGSMFFGGINGITWFNPAEMTPLPPPDVAFTGFRLFNKPANFKQPNSPLEKDINYVSRIQLEHSQNMFTIQFAALDYRKTSSVSYRYKLTGFDKDWIYTDHTHEATYTNLDPGDYTFMVQGSNTSGFWGNSAATMFISVHPPWWRTWWFYLLSALAVVLIINTIYKYRVRQLLKLERVRNRIARDLHDEIGSSLSTISIYSKVVEKQLTGNEGATHPLLAKINENAIEVQEAMNDIIWSINTRNDDFESIVNRMREHAVELLEAKDYQLHFTVEETLKHLKLKMEQRRDFYLIYKEALNNTAKYADGKNVWLSLTTAHSCLLLSVRDDGKGFNSTESPNNRNGLSNMQSRAKALKGSLQVISEPGRGTTVILTMPLRK